MDLFSDFQNEKLKINTSSCNTLLENERQENEYIKDILRNVRELLKQIKKVYGKDLSVILSGPFKQTKHLKRS